jgi:hypothetical protein
MRRQRGETVARAAVRERVVRKTVKIPVKKIVLELTEGEADFLLALSAHVGGSDEDSPRKYMHRISRALVKATGHVFFETDAFPLADPSQPSGVLFANYPDPRGAPKRF